MNDAAGTNEFFGSVTACGAGGTIGAVKQKSHCHNDSEIFILVQSLKKFINIHKTKFRFHHCS